MLVPTEQKDNTIAIDFDGVIHRYSQGFQGVNNAYDDPTPGTRHALDSLKSDGYRLIILSSRPEQVIREWLDKHNMSHYFDDVSNYKHPARHYIDDRAVRFPRGEGNAWERIIDIVRNLDKDFKGRKNEDS